MKKDYGRLAVMLLLCTLFATVYAFQQYVQTLIIPPPKEITFYRVNISWKEDGGVSFDLINKATGKKNVELVSFAPGEDGMEEGYMTMTVGTFDSYIDNDFQIDNLMISESQEPWTIEFPERRKE